MVIEHRFRQIKKLLAVFVSLVMIVALSPVRAQAAELSNDVSADIAPSASEIRLSQGITSGPHSVSSGQSIDFYFQVTQASRVAFAFAQKNSLTSGNSLHAKLEDEFGKVLYEWDVSRDTTNVILGDFIVGPGKHYIRLTANCNVTNLQIKLSSDALGYGFKYEVEPNDAAGNATPINLGKQYIGSIYDPNSEFYVLGSMQGLNDVDIYSFTLAGLSDVTLTLNTPGKINYELTTSTSTLSFKTGQTGSGDQKTEVKCSALSPGTYYLVIRGGNEVWGKEYVFDIAAQDTIQTITKVQLSQNEFVYSGDYYNPEITVWVGDKKIVENLGYYESSSYVSVTGNRGKNAGTYTVTVKGKGNYSGTLTTSFTIKPRQITRIVLGKTQFDYLKGYAQVPWNVTVYSGTERVDYLYPDRPEGSNSEAIFPSNSINPGKYTVTVNGLRNYTGTLSATYEIVDPSGEYKNSTSVNSSTAIQVMYRCYNPNSGEHFYTASAAERDALKKAGWKYEGEGWKAPKLSKTPVYRLYSGTDHHYTTSAAERDALKKAGWKYEGIGWYSDDNKGVGLHRVYNPNVNPKAARNNSGSHHYTTSVGEKNALVKTGWKYENIGWYGCK